MAKKASAQGDFRTIVSNIKKGDFAPVYLLMGEETYYIDKLVELLEARVVPEEEEREFNFTTVYGQEADLAQVIATCQQYPFMAERRIVLLKEAQSLYRAKQALDALAPYVERPNDKCVLVVTFKGDNLNATSDLMKAASKAGAVVFKSPMLREWEVGGPIAEYCREKRLAIGEDAINMLTEYVGQELSKLFGAIDKLIASGAIENGRITPELIASQIGVTKEYNNFELQTALANKNYDRCLRIVKYFQSNPKKNPTPMTTGMLFGFFSKLLIGQMSGQTTEQGLMAAMGIKSNFAFKDYRPALRNYNVKQTVNAIHQLRWFDTHSKGVGSNQNEYSLLIEMIFNIFSFS